ncbi:MAG TPA: ABC transporter substrate-binding protein [Mycobacteriales bacterium]|nr:ABC transporter substrate-binding protein [Mycobacteriales bacterium]
MSHFRRPFLLVAAVSALVAVAACAPTDDNTSPVTGTSATSGGSSCDKAGLKLVTAGKLTVGTDSPAFEPWFSDNKPSNGKGFESAVAYAVAQKLGFAQSDVAWTTVPFNSSFAPGRKKFDFDINQISITPERQKAVDFSAGYYTVTQAVVALNDSKVANATTLAELKDAKLGAQIGTTSLQAIQSAVKPSKQPAIYNDNNDVKSALQNGTIDAAVFDLPTSFFLTAAEIKDSKIVGQFPSSGAAEQFGLLFEKGNPLVTCVNTALSALRADGTLAKIQDQWLAAAAGAPVLK